MAVISFSENEPERTWSVAGWAFRQVLDDVISQYPEDAEMVDEFEQSKTYSGLILYTLKPGFAARIRNALRQVASGILSGVIRSGIHDQPYGDTTTVEQYREGLRQLLEAIPDSDRK
jgi:hypothetical protein